MTEEQIQAIVDSTDSDQKAGMEFSQNLLREWMRRNSIEGMNIPQSLWVFSRFEEFTVVIDGQNKHIDMFKMFQAGALPTLYYCLLKIVPDDMSKPYHWVTQARVDWVKNKIAAFIGPQTAGYIQTLP